MSEIQDAIDRAVPIFAEGGLSGAMYRTDSEDDTEAFAVDVADWNTITKAARQVADASVLAGGGDQWIMDWEGELIHPTDLPDGRYLVIPIDPPKETDA